MKKVLIALCAFALSICAPFLLVGCDKNDYVSVRVQDGYVQWQTKGESSWNNIISVDDLMAEIGDIKGENGVNREQVDFLEFQKSTTHIQWRYVGNSTWNNLIEYYTLSYDINFPEKISNETLSQEIPNTIVAKSDGYMTPTPQFANSNLNIFFKGWAIKGHTDTIVNPYLAVVSDAELIGVWDTALITEQLALCNNFTLGTYNTISEAWVKTCSDTTSTSLTFPSYYIFNKKVYKVTVIQSNSTISNSSCVDVIIPNTVTKIYSFFEGFSALKNVSLPNTLKYLAGFSDNLSIETITIPESVETIGGYAFDGCSNLKSVYIKSHSEIENCKKLEIGVGAFKDCINLEIFTGSSSNSYNSNSIPARVKTIEAEAFMSCSKLNHLIFSSYISTLGNSIVRAYYCNSIGVRAFYGCSSIERIEFSQEITNFNISLITNEYRIKIESEAFANCTSLASFVEHGFVSEIGSHCFENCTELSIFESCWNNINFGTFIFKGCTSLINLTIGNIYYSTNIIHNQQRSLNLGRIVCGSSINRISINTDAFFNNFECTLYNGETFPLTKITLNSNISLFGEFKTYIVNNYNYMYNYYLIKE